MKKREEFSVSLRKKKKQEIIQSKRRRAEWNGGSSQFNGSPTAPADSKHKPSDEEDEDSLQLVMSIMPEAVVESKWDHRIEWLLQVLSQEDYKRDGESEEKVWYIKYNILRFLRSSIACADKEIKNIELIRQSSILPTLAQFFRLINMM